MGLRVTQTPSIHLTVGSRQVSTRKDVEVAVLRAFSRQGLRFRGWGLGFGVWGQPQGLGLRSLNVNHNPKNGIQGYRGWGEEGGGGGGGVGLRRIMVPA